MNNYKEKFDTYIGVKLTPNDREKYLFERAKKYTKYLSYIPGVRMIAVVNSLSMYATHEDSDIDLFIITQRGSIWFVRFFSTLLLSSLGVWRHGEDVAGNFCLSFFITTEAMNLEDITIENDIYLFYWTYYMKPLYDVGGTYDTFVQANKWLGEERLLWGKEAKESLSLGDTRNLPNKDMRDSPLDRDGKKNKILSFFDSLIRFFLLPRARASYERLGKPEGVIISDTMLKFHDQDKRKEIRDAIRQKNFDK